MNGNINLEYREFTVDASTQGLRAAYSHFLYLSIVFRLSLTARGLRSGVAGAGLRGEPGTLPYRVQGLELLEVFDASARVALRR